MVFADEGLCNGQKNCGDNSDEDESMCTVLPDPSYSDPSKECSGNENQIAPGGNDGSTFRCKGGWCLPMKGLCNGQKNCGDNSDEDESKCAVLPDPSYSEPSKPCSGNENQIAPGGNDGSTFRCK